jgi:hypothetical protein
MSDRKKASPPRQRRKLPRRNRSDDLKMLKTVEAQLSLPDEELNLTPQYTRQVLTRLHELLPKRPSHRPKVDDSGEFVFVLVQLGYEPDLAIRHVAKVRGKTEAAVKRAYERHPRYEQQK